MAIQAIFVELGGNIGTQIGMHSPGFRQEYATRRVDIPALAQDPVETGTVGRIGMRSLEDLRELPGIADENKVVRRIGHRDQVRQGNLARLINEEIIKRPLQLVPRKQPCRASDNLGSMDGGVVVAGHAVDRRADLGRKIGIARDLVGEAHISGGKAGILRPKRTGTSHQYVADGLVAVGGHRNALAVPNQRENRPYRDMGLAGAGRPLDRQDRPVHRPHGPDHAIDRPVTFFQRQWRRTVESGRVLRE